MTALSSVLTTERVHRYQFLEHRWSRLQVNEKIVHSLPSLLAVPDALERVLSFLGERRGNILWLSNEFCISSIIRLDQRKGANVLWYTTFTITDATNDVDSLYLCGLRSAELSSVVPVLEALFQLFAWHKTISQIRFCCNDDLNFASVPVSPSALETFVGQAKSPRLVDLYNAPLSAEQCRVLAFGCNENIKLIVNVDHWEEGIAFLTEALMLNQSPRRLNLRRVMRLPDDSFNAFLVAVESNTSLLELGFDIWTRADTRRVALFRAICKNKGLQCLDLDGVCLLATEWKVLWEESLSRHTTIRTVNVSNTLPPESHESEDDRLRRDAVMVRSVRTNHVLTKIEYSDADHSPNTMDEEVLPILQLNRFRPLVEAIKQEVDQALRGRLFAMTLLHDRVVCNIRPAFLFLLLQENPDLLVQSFPTREDQLRRLRQRWNQIFERLSAAELEINAVEEAMEEYGEDLPSLPHTYSMLARKQRKR